MGRDIAKLEYSFDLARREGLVIKNTFCNTKTESCQNMLSDLQTIINVIKKNAAIKHDFFSHGNKVCVVGRTFSHTDGTNHVFAYDMVEYGDDDNDFGIKFQQHLIDAYENKYLKV